MEATFSYVDLSGFTALTEAHGDEVAADVAERFVVLIEDALGAEDRILKTVGDAALVSSPDPDSAVVFLCALYELLAEQESFPGVRAGVHHGSATVRGPEVYGQAINLAARIAAHAHSGQAFATAVVAEAAERAGIEVTKLGEFDLHNIARPVVLYDLDVRAAEGDAVEDPVCRMELERDRAPARLRYKHVDYYFCSLLCAGDFSRNPHLYAFD